MHCLQSECPKFDEWFSDLWERLRSDDRSMCTQLNYLELFPFFVSSGALHVIAICVCMCVKAKAYSNKDNYVLLYKFREENSQSTIYSPAGGYMQLFFDKCHSVILWKIWSIMSKTNKKL